jgi:WD40 repeat protein
VWSPDGKTVAIGEEQPGAPSTLRILDASSRRCLKALASPPGSGGLTWSPDGKLLAFITGRTLRIWKVESGEILVDRSAPNIDLQAMSWSPEAAALLSLWAQTSHCFT